MVIEVCHSKVVYMHGEVQHLVGCRFVRRIDEELAAPARVSHLIA